MIRFENLALRRGHRLLFSDADVQIHSGQKVGVIGANGVGKTSLFSLMVGELQPDSGECWLPSGWDIGVVEQEELAGERTAIDYVMDGDIRLRNLESQLREAEQSNKGLELARLHAQMEDIDGYTARSRAAQVLDGLGFGPHQVERRVDTFSGGWRMRLNLGRVLMRRSDLLLLDEPTNHLDLDAILWLEEWLRRYAGTLMLISHDREFLDRVADHMLNIENGHVRMYRGNYSAFERRRSEQLSNQKAQYERQQREIKHIQSYVDRFRYKASKARQAQSRLKALQRMVRIVPAHVDSPFGFSFFAPHKMSATLLSVSDCTVSYDQHPVLSGVSLQLSPGDRIGLLGANGAGKSTLIKLLSGELTPIEGEREESRDLRVGYFAQSQLEQLQLDASPLQHMRSLGHGAREQELRDYLGNFGFSGEQALCPVRPFSGGEKSRLVLALLIYQRPNLLLLDEPTNHLDLEMRQALASALQGYTGAMVLVSHDRYLLRVACDELLLVDHGQVNRYDDSLDDYARWLAQRDRQTPVNARQSGSVSPSINRKDKKRKEANLRQRLSPLSESVKIAEDAIARLRQERIQLESAMADNELYTESQNPRLMELLRQKSELDRALDDAEEAWVQASEDLESALDNENL